MHHKSGFLRSIPIATHHLRAFDQNLSSLTKRNWVARIVGKELLPRRIRVNMVSPGPTDTEIFKRDASPEEIQGMRDMLSGVVPMGRMGTSEEIARAALFLASDEASFINGVDLYVDGGCIEL